jgi:hypothetical protein
LNGLKTVEKILVIVLLLLLVVPAIQKAKPFVPLKKLEGDFVLTPKPELSIEGWMSGDFQEKFNRYLEENIGFRNFLVRLINQIDFSLFRTTHAEGVLVGKNDQLFEYDYIRAFDGVDFIGEENIDRKIRKLKFIQEYLKKTKNIDLVLVFEPGKTTYYEEFIPGKYLKNLSGQNNYNVFVNKARDYHLRYLDFNAWFKKLRKTAKYPLYPQYGTHWSIYGMSVAADSLIRYIEEMRQINLPDIYVDSLIVKATPERPDYDIASTLNLMFRLPPKEQLAYPVYRFEDNPEKQRPMVLAIADSYYWNMYNAGIPKNLFKNYAFWYFYGRAYPESYGKDTFVKDLNLKQEIEKQDIIFLMVTERFLHKLGWGFIEDAYALYGPLSRIDTINNYICSIADYDAWFTKEIEKARVRNVTFEKDLSLNADYIYSQRDLNGLLMLKGPAYFEEEIRNDRRWLKEIQRKADEQNTVLYEMIRKDAIYMFETNYKESYQNYLKLKAIKETIISDSLLSNKINELAGQYYLTFEEALQIEAERIYDNKTPF